MLLTLGGHDKAVSNVKWGGGGLIYTASRDTSIYVWESEEGKLVRQLKGHGHWVNTLALSTEHAIRTGANDHTGKAPPSDPEEAKEVNLPNLFHRPMFQPPMAAGFPRDPSCPAWGDSLTTRP